MTNMKKFAIVCAAFFTALLGVAFTNLNIQYRNIGYDEVNKRRSSAISCAPDRAFISSLINDYDIPPMPGSGNYHWTINTQNDSAQFYFNQGINMYYGFHIIESLASFKKAAFFDPTSPMLWWAQGLALGPNINDMAYESNAEAYEVTIKAKEFSNNATDLEKKLIAAMGVRYSKNKLHTRKELNQQYADALKAIYKEYSCNADVSALYADALMLLHPWEYWYPNGLPKEWTSEIQTVLEGILKIAPYHPGANHYYIHIMEASPNASKALASADILSKLSPGLSHIVHMPSHIYLRTGNYPKGISLNDQAITQFSKYSSIYPPSEANKFLYLWHNQHMLANFGLLSGQYKKAYETALELQKSIDTSMLSLPAPDGLLVQYIYMTPVLINLHFSKWNVLNNIEKPNENHIYATILYHLAKGAAAAFLNNTKGAYNHLYAMQDLLPQQSLTIPMGPFSPPLEGAKIASELLQGFIAMKENQTLQAITNFKNAAEIEENMVYNEPRDWLLNPKQYLGAAYLKAHLWQEAEVVFKKDLAQNNGNVWALYGLQKALRKEKKNNESNLTYKQYKENSKYSDARVDKLFFENQ